MVDNICATAGCFNESDSGRFVSLQFSQFFISGTWNDYLKTYFDDPDVRNELYRAVASLVEIGLSLEAFKDFNLQVFTSDSNRLSALLFVFAVKAGRWDFARLVLDSTPVEQAALHREFAHPPTTQEEADFQGALNSYARNELVYARAASTSAPFSAKLRVIIHIGSTKTGSTYLQHFLEENRPALLRQGIWYPEVGLFWQKGRAHKQAGHAHIGRAAIRRNYLYQDYIAAGLELAEGKIHTIILSSESFFLNTKTVALADYFAGCNVEIVCYLRSQDDWANSQYAEFVAGGAVNKVSVPIEDWLSEDLTKSRLDYYALLETWASKVGEEKVHARIFDRSRMYGGDIVTDFCHLIGHDQLLDLARPASSQSNQFPLETAHIHAIRHFNQLPWTNAETYLQFIEDVTNAIRDKRLSEGRPVARPALLSIGQRRKILADCEASNRKLATKYLGLSEAQAAFDLEVTTDDPGHTAELEVAEFEIMASLYDRYKPKPKNDPGPRQANNSTQRDSLASSNNRTPIARSEFDSALTYRTFVKLSKHIMSDRLHRKLRTKPDLFFSDARSPISRSVGKLVLNELKRKAQQSSCK